MGSGSSAVANGVKDATPAQLKETFGTLSDEAPAVCSEALELMAVFRAGLSLQVG